ncbi:hypothetical protein EPN15_04850, partial [Patescibacteria group bacterium]
HTCALKTDGSMVCWGNNASGQIGDNSTTQRNVPTQVSGLTAGTVKEIAAGGYHTCALKTNGSVVCWGDNTWGQIGDNSTTQRNVPTQVSGLTAGTVKEIAAGDVHTCALKTNGSMVCWGYNTNGQIGDNTTTQRNIPTQVSGLTAGTVKEITAGVHTCVIKTDGSMMCWGRNDYGQIGDNTTTQRNIPTQVSGLTAGTVKEITAGFYHTCSLKTNGSTVCWGSNTNGQIGDNTTTQRNIPAQVSGLTAGTVKEVTAGGYHTCALKTDGSTVCWGKNTNGQIGDNTTTERWPPTQVSGLTVFLYYSLGAYTSIIKAVEVVTSFEIMSWMQTLPAGTSITMKVRSCDDSACSAAGTVDESLTKQWASISPATSGNDISGDGVTDGDGWIQYQAILNASADQTQTSSLDSITINYSSASGACYDLTPYLVPQYLDKIPEDPKNTNGQADTGYTIYKDTATKEIIIGAPMAENGEIIEARRK